MLQNSKGTDQSGFTIIELVLACVIFPIIVVGLANAFDAVRKAYVTGRQLNEVYAVLSACPEVDRAIAYNSISSTNNCYPTNVFAVEGGGSGTITYEPSLTVTDTSSLDPSDPLSTIPDSKVVNVLVSIPNNPAPALQVRLLITRNGIGQL